MYYHSNVAALVEFAQDAEGRICYMLYDSTKSLRAERYGDLAPYLVAKWPVVRHRTTLIYLYNTARELGEVAYA
jgi:hypothetical protein